MNGIETIKSLNDKAVDYARIAKEPGIKANSASPAPTPVPAGWPFHQPTTATH